MSDSPPDEENIRDLVTKYKQEKDWDSLLSAAERTSEVVRLLAEALVQEERVNTESMTALQRLCKHDSRYPVDSKIDDVQDLDIPESVKKELESQITESVGSVGGPLFEVQIPEEYEQETLEFLGTLVTETEEEILDTAIEEFASHDISGPVWSSFSYRSLSSSDKISHRQWPFQGRFGDLFRPRITQSV